VRRRSQHPIASNDVRSVVNLLLPRESTELNTRFLRCFRSEASLAHQHRSQSDTSRRRVLSVIVLLAAHQQHGLPTTIRSV